MAEQNANKFEKFRQKFMDSFSEMMKQALEEEEQVPELAEPCQWIRKVSELREIFAWAVVNTM